MVTKLIVNGETAIVGSSGSAKGLRIDFIGTGPIFSDELPIEVSVSMETIYSTDFKIGEHLNGLFLYRGELVVGDCEITAVLDDSINTNLVEISHTGMGGFPSFITSSEQLAYMSAGAYMPNLVINKASEETYVVSTWDSIGSKIFSIITDGDGDESIYSNEMVSVSEEDIPFSGAVRGIRLPFYILWLHRENEDSPYKCYLGIYKFVRPFGNRYNFQRTQDLIPLFTPESDLVTMEDVNAAIDAAIDAAITGAINASY